MTIDGRVLILGASARAAAASAQRAGLEPFAIDLFADADTRQLCECVRCPPEEYPGGLFRLAKRMPPMPWLYTGGLENYPELIGELAAERDYRGNGPDILHDVRHPFALSAILSVKGLAHPALLCSGAHPADDAIWLRKPVRGSGGRGIRRARSDELSNPGEGHYLQALVPGPPMSAVFAGIGSNSKALGFAAQLIGTPWLHAKPFQYAGNVFLRWPGPYHTQDVGLTAFRLANRVGMVGLFGIDFILNEETSYTVEVNPRYTASIEVIEYATGGRLLDWHRWCFRRRSDHPADVPNTTRIVGKAIYYAPHRITFPASGPWDDSLRHAADVWRRPDFADIPHAGTMVEPGQPVLTILTEADTEAECLSQLRAKAAELDRLFGFRTPTEEESCPP